ncbi:heterogeneous nuclear ribonucleoprotein A0-like [Oryzias latipes]|uniref:heterogeneous nuclear ribonucleoprotein A0-like n=1 Tax=Oryzias latipes TaxID=8090 RepID=UPI000CE244E7|nr:heterogeneous nuclear ribonucleoprotein A0-like [Oryzias latipes]
MTNKVCKLFIGGLCVNTNDDGLRKHFEQFGTLTDFVVLQNKNAQRSRCFGFVTYSTPEEANAAMAAAPHTVEGNSVEVKRAIPKAKDNKSEAFAKGEKIFVGGLRNDIKESHLTDYFSWYGQVEKSEILLEKETGKKRGFGFVHFTHHNSADLALVVKYHTVNGHLVEVKKAVAKQEMQAGNRTETTTRHRPGPGMMENQTGYGGFGFGTYYTPEETNTAMAAAPHTVQRNSVKVKVAVPKRKANESAAPAKGEKIFVGGLKNNIEEYHLTDYFSRYGQVEKSEILLEKETGKKRGFGFVHFTHHKTADLALVEKYHTVNGHLVEVKKAVARQEMQAGNRTETTPRHRPGQCMMESQNGYCGLAYGECCCPCHLSYSKNGNRGYSYPQNRYRGSGYSYQENE